MKNLFHSKTTLGFLLSLAMFSLPYVEKLTKEKTTPLVATEHREDFNQTVALAFATLASGLGIYSKYKVGDTYTPRGLPGRNKDT